MSRAVSVTDNMTNGPMASGSSAGSGGSAPHPDTHYDSTETLKRSSAHRQRQWRTFNDTAARVAANGKSSWDEKQQRGAHGSVAGNNIEKEDNHRWVVFLKQLFSNCRIVN